MATGNTSTTDPALPLADWCHLRGSAAMGRIGWAEPCSSRVLPRMYIAPECTRCLGGGHRVRALRRNDLTTIRLPGGAPGVRLARLARPLRPGKDAETLILLIRSPYSGAR